MCPSITLRFEALREPLVAQGALTVLLAPVLVSGVDGLVGAGSGLFDETDILDEFREPVHVSTVGGAGFLDNQGSAQPL